MRKHLPILATLLCGVLVWAAVMWPLPARFTSAVPIADRAPSGATRVMGTVPGDHLQLLYHFWLAREVVTGKMPAGSNVYEFNIDGDDSRREFSSHYVPFSLVYTAVSPLLGRAAGWNAAGLFSILLGVLGAFFLARRYCESDWLAFFVAAALSAFPYRWGTLVAGSPTGFAIGLVPWLAYGLDRLVRDCSAWGSAIAGAALLFAFCSDLHVFYFSALAAPLFVAVPAVHSGGGEALKAPRRALLAAIPLALLAGIALAMSKLASSGLDSTAMAGGRTWRETMLFSPVLRGLFTTRTLEGATNSIYIGLFAGIFFPLAAVRLILETLRAGDRKAAFRTVATEAILAAAALGAVLLAAGTYGPLGGLPFKLARSFIPKYTMIRQSAKIFCLLPTLLTMIAAMSLRGVRRKALDCACMALAVAMLVQQIGWFRVAVSRLDNPMDSYRAAAARAAADGISKPKAIAIPIWPGDSHYASLYEMGVMESGLRLINGYSPSPPADYLDKVFKPLESLNQGRLDAGQRALLKGMGVDFLIFHEDAFPDKVSPFPAGVTLDEFLRNPALELIHQGERTAAFKLRDDTASRAAAADGHCFLDYAPSLVWRERQVRRSLETASAPGRINLALRAPVEMHPGMRYMILDGVTGWHQIPLDNPIGGDYALPEGVSDIRLMFLAAGGLEIGDGRITPARMFHNGTSLADGTVTLGVGDASARHCAIEGPFEPLPAGRWRLTAVVDGACDNEATLEVARGVRGDCESVATKPFKRAAGKNGGDTASIDFDIGAADLPFAFRIVAGQGAPMTIRSIVVEPLGR